MTVFNYNGINQCACCSQEIPVNLDATVSLDYKCLMWKGIRCDLTGQETLVMKALLDSEPQWVTLGQFEDAIYDDDANVDIAANIKQHLYRIRSKLKEADIPILIEPQSGAGRRPFYYAEQSYRLKYGY